MPNAARTDSAPVVDAVGVAVREAVEQLLEHAAPRGLRQRAVHRDLLEQLAASHQLQHDVHLRSGSNKSRLATLSRGLTEYA